MKKYLIVLDSSYLAQNIYNAILSDYFYVEAAYNIEDIDVILRDKIDVFAVIVASRAYDENRWKAVTSRNPVLKTFQKIFVSETEFAPNGFIYLKRPFEMNELLLKLNEHC